ncbi:MAG: hypothetical protein AUK47_15290 [Deltaproteobacteria bacterium CG2_30_63_29]|nr:MAG: hypothetical protein AUK47_15290 [Deltaproteobacteria bacterium CG2_30_63_29]PJB40820.1 MAG: hypothetical protein CO108_14185 [Deltaproteobacteria bacterium CG_4_9_14_3_um_filter_63_12]
MSQTQAVTNNTPFVDRVVPSAGIRVQLICAAMMWLIGASILLVRGVGYVHDRHWHAWALGTGLVIGVLKSRFVLDKFARKSIRRIRERGRGMFLGFFSLRTWGMIAVMMSAGILLRTLFVHPGQIGAGIIGAIYIGIGSALLIADRVFWTAVLSPDGPAAKTQGE